jgi:hypothetical protein
LELEKRKNKVEEKIITEYVDKIVYIDKWRSKNVEVTKYITSSCELPNNWVSIHDASARGVHVESSRTTDETASGIETVEALRGVIENYATCKENSERLIALQTWIHEQEKIINQLKRDGIRGNKTSNEK